MSATTRVETSCYHCGDTCREDHIQADGHDFCCSGCRFVYDLLQESGLCDFYALGERPGVKNETPADAPRPELFDLPEVRDRLVEYSEEGITRVTFHIPQMHCSSCIWLLENLHRLEPAVLRSRVRFGDKELSITFREETLGLRGLVELLRRIGYGPQLTGEGSSRSGKGRRKVPRTLYVQLGVAGFFFGNIMLFSFPEYLGATPGTDAGLARGFQFLSMVFSLPVVLFSDRDFFINSFAGLRMRQVNIDQPIALGIIALFVRSALDVITGTGPGYFDSLAGLVFFLLVGRWYQTYTYQALSFDHSLDAFLPLVILRKRGELEEPVGVTQLGPGDRIVVRDQELIPVDAILRDGVGNIDNSFITGEPIPIHKKAGELVKAGGRQRGPAIELEVVRPFSESHLKQLWEEHSGSGKQGRPAMPRLIDTVARRFTFAVLLIALGAGLYWWGRDPGQVWQVVTAVLIVACPCALALSMPFAYGHTMRALGRKGIFLRDTEVVERMALVDTVVFDKTGTLTAREAYEIQFLGEGLSARELTYVRTLARNSTHPLSAAIYAGTKSTLGTVSGVSETTGAGIAGTVDGLPVRIGSRVFTGGEEFERLVGTAEVHVNIGGVHRGRFALRKRTRDGMRTTIGRTRELARTWLLTGDPTVDTEVADMFPGDAAVSGCSPVEKAAFVVARQAEGARVMMVGDGLNDAGALQQSDVGVTVSESSAALTPASDAIIDAQSIVRLPGALLLARRARRIVFASLGISLLYNVVGVSVAISGHLTPLVAAILMPLSSVTVVGFVSLSVHLVSRSIFHSFDTDESHVTP